jgi:hypothetical protein
VLGDIAIVLSVMSRAEGECHHLGKRSKFVLKSAGQGIEMTMEIQKVSRSPRAGQISEKPKGVKK